MNTKTGFVLGKFMPCHHGHKFLFDCASTQVERLYILVCTRDCEEIDGILRYEWVKKLAPKNAVVIHMHRDIPQEPDDDINFWRIWEKAIKELISEPITTVFGSEQYVIKLAQVLSAKPCIIDLKRNHVDICATKIRQSSSEYWDYIPDNVKHYYQKRLCILGPQSTGKSYLTQYLSSKFKLDFVNEYGRDYDYLYKKGEDWNAEDFINIATCHESIQKQVSLRGSHVIIEDTDIIQTIVWSQFLLGFIPIELHLALKNIKKADTYLLLSPETPWINDGTRYEENNKQRYNFYSELKDLLDYLDLNYIEIKSSDYLVRQSLACDELLKLI